MNLAGGTRSDHSAFSEFMFLIYQPKCAPPQRARPGECVFPQDVVNKILITRLGRVYSNKSDQIPVKSFMVPSEYGAGPWERADLSAQSLLLLYAYNFTPDSGNKK
jgi:hypothetical protein